MSLEVVVALLSTAACGCLVLGVRGALATDNVRVDQRLRQYGAGSFELIDEERKQVASQQVTRMLVERVEASISGRTFVAALKTELAQANLKLRVAEFLIIQVTTAITLGAFAFLISREVLVALAFATFGWFLPRLWVGRRRSARLKAFDDQLADTIALMSNSLRSGLSLVQSMDMISREAEAPIAEEFQRVVREIGLGVGPQEALQNLARRVRSDDLELLVTAILVQFEIGGNLSRILDSIATTIRERVKLHGEIRTMSAQGRMSGYILSGMPAAISGLLMLIAPSYLGALFTPGPWLVLPGIAMVGIVVGSLVIRKLVAIDV
jgi:tight adherence protein B